MLERLQQLGGDSVLFGPGVRQSLDAVRVGVLGRGEAAALEAQLADEVVERPLGDVAVVVLAGREPRVEVRRHEQRVVVQHLLEVRHEPLRVDGVAVEAAADEVVQPTRRHSVEREPDGVERPTPQEELERRRRRELRRVPEAAQARVELPE